MLNVTMYNYGLYSQEQCSVLFDAMLARLQMVAFLFQCPTTGQHVQGWLADDPAASEEQAHEYEPVTCLACTRIHLVNRSTKRLLDTE